MKNVRRRFLKVAGLGGLGAALGRGLARGAEGDSPTPVSEKLMLEHAVVHRMLLVFDEAADRLEAGEGLPDAVGSSAAIVDQFIENYHEELEEKLIFPALERHEEHGEMVEELRRQHKKGRQLTAQAYQLLGGGDEQEEPTRGRLIDTFRTYTRMYRAHASWEDTTAFSALREVMGADQFRQVSGNIGTVRRDILGTDGLEQTLKRRAGVEKALGIDTLTVYTRRAIS